MSIPGTSDPSLAMPNGPEVTWLEPERPLDERFPGLGLLLGRSACAQIAKNLLEYPGCGAPIALPGDVRLVDPAPDQRIRAFVLNELQQKILRIVPVIGADEERAQIASYEDPNGRTHLISDFNMLGSDLEHPSRRSARIRQQPKAMYTMGAVLETVLPWATEALDKIDPEHDASRIMGHRMLDRLDELGMRHPYSHLLDCFRPGMVPSEETKDDLGWYQRLNELGVFAIATLPVTAGYLRTDDARELIIYTYKNQRELEPTKKPRWE